MLTEVAFRSNRSQLKVHLSKSPCQDIDKAPGNYSSAIGIKLMGSKPAVKPRAKHGFCGDIILRVGGFDPSTALGTGGLTTS